MCVAVLYIEKNFDFFVYLIYIFRIKKKSKLNDKIDEFLLFFYVSKYFPHKLEFACWLNSKKSTLVENKNYTKTYFGFKKIELIKVLLVFLLSLTLKQHNLFYYSIRLYCQWVLYDVFANNILEKKNEKKTKWIKKRMNRALIESLKIRFFKYIYIYIYFNICVYVCVTDPIILFVVKNASAILSKNFLNI